MEVNLNCYDVLALDLDGTIYVGDEIIEGAQETIYKLRSMGKKLLFISNTPTQSRIDTVMKLKKLGIEAAIDEVLTAAYLTACYLNENCSDCKVLIVGEKSLIDECQKLGIPCTNNPLEATHVVVGLDRTFTYETMNRAMQAVINGAALIVTNPDPSCPVAEGQFVADTMAIAKAIEVAASGKITAIVGKPSAYYASKMVELLKCEPSRCLIVGDRLETDILLGMHLNIETCLVLSGIAKKEHLAISSIQPNYIINSIKDFIL
ncbi:HAD-IIA family hydrolase [Lysinibacillus telephonicus]|uniref:HAD-IIA family hydrolase n=1 Tax=Lysinibacillus telephonicus TaxID=1714840 RepID=UPI0037CD06A6